MDENRVVHDTWWLVDNGFIGTDGVARTASPPFEGIDASGEYAIMRSPFQNTGTPIEVALAIGSSGAFGGLGFSLAGMNASMNIAGIIQSQAIPVHVIRWKFGIPQATDVIMTRSPDQGIRFDLDAALPAAQTPWGKVSLPNITQAEFAAISGNLLLTLDNPTPGEFVGTIAVRALFPDGSHLDVQTLPGGVNGIIAVTTPPTLAVASVRWQLVRQIPTDQPNVPSRFLGGEPIEFGGNSVSIRPEPDMAAVLSRTGITFMRENKVIAETALVNGIGIDNNFGGTYLTGLKSQPVAFSNDLSRVFVAGKGQIYVIDLVSFKLIDTIAVPAAGNISSLVTTGNMLIIAEGSSYGSGGSRLLVMDTSPRASADQDTLEPPSIVSLKGTGVEGAPKDVHGMAVGPDGYTLVVTVPQAANSFAAFVGNLPKGNVLIFDLRTLNLKTGTIGAPVVADLPSDGISGKGPETVTATYDADRFLVATPNDFDRGLSTLVLTRDADGKVTGAKLTAIRMFQPGSSIKLDRLDIQRADSAVLVERNGIEYAVVADDNYNFKDTYWMAMFEAPMWIQLVPLQFGPPTAVGGSASAKQVNVGGKIGIIQDPFGTPKFMGATLPLDGYGIKNLSMSEDGRVVIGQLAGYLGTNKSTTSTNLNYAWNIDSLIEAAINMPENKRLRDHLTPVAAEGKVPSMVINGAYTAWAPAGTAFDPDAVEVTFHGRAGDNPPKLRISPTNFKNK